MKNFKGAGHLFIQKVWDLLLMILVFFVIAETIKPGATEFIIQQVIEMTNIHQSSLWQVIGGIAQLLLRLVNQIVNFILRSLGLIR